MQPRATSLMSVPPGKPVTVREILFEGLRAYCAERGLYDGGQVTLLEADPREVLIRSTSGTRVRCPAAFARFVEVASEGGAPEQLVPPSASATPIASRGMTS
jgi:hypothetical protein